MMYSDLTDASEYAYEVCDVFVQERKRYDWRGRFVDTGSFAFNPPPIEMRGANDVFIYSV